MLLSCIMSQESEKAIERALAFFQGTEYTDVVEQEEIDSTPGTPERRRLFEAEIDYLAGLASKLHIAKAFGGAVNIFLMGQQEETESLLSDMLDVYGTVSAKMPGQYRAELMTVARRSLLTSVKANVGQLSAVSSRVGPYVVGLSLANRNTFPILSFSDSHFATKTATLVRGAYIHELEKVATRETQSGSTVYEIRIPYPSIFIKNVMRTSTIQHLPPKAVARFGQLAA